MGARSLSVLHLPQNIASLVSHSVRYLRQAGVDAQGWVYGDASLQSSEGLERFSAKRAASPLARAVARLRWWLQMAPRVARVDVVHWYYGRPLAPYALDLAWIAWLRKPALVEWMGSDIRQAEIESRDNPYYRQSYAQGYEYARSETHASSQRAQAQFARAGFAAAADHGLFQYFDRQLYPQPYYLPRRLILDEYPPAFPALTTSRPLVIHSPSAPVAKGTPAVLEAVSRLKQEYTFDFELVQGLPWPQALARLQQADIVLDQFVLGDFGMVALEGMAFGKPVICYLKPALVEAYSPELPVVNATQENLAGALLALLQAPSLRRELGERGRTYIAHFADLKVVAPLMVEIYQELRYARGRHV